MRLGRSALGLVVNFLLGVAWAMVLIGALYTFFSYFRYSLVEAVFVSFLGALPGLFFVIVLEYLIIGIEKLEEMKKQTALLEKLVEQNRAGSGPEDTTSHSG